MSVTAIGPAFTLDAPRPVAPPYGLLSVPGVLADDERERWLNGVNMFGFPTQDTWTWDPCSAGTFRVKPETDFAWPVNGAVDPSIVKVAISAGADKVIARSDSLQENSSLSYTPNAARPIGGGTTAVVADARWIDVVRDAMDVRDGLVPVLDRTSALVVLGSHLRPGPGPLAPGSHAASIVRHAAVPALVVPLPPTG